MKNSRMRCANPSPRTRAATASGVAGMSAETVGNAVTVTSAVTANVETGARTIEATNMDSVGPR
jgi:hypothetical protein